MDADRVTLYVERFEEPYTGMPLVGVGGYCADPVDRVEVRYDGATATVAKAIAAPLGSPHAYYFAVHLPVEANISRLQVVAVADGRDEVWYDGPFAAIRFRGSVTPKTGWASKFTPVNLLSPRKWKGRVSRAIEAARTLRQKIEFRLLKRRFRPHTLYDTFVQGTALTPAVRQSLREEAVEFRYRPVVSILCPVYNVEPKWLAEAVDSVRRQIYDCWELCLADDASTNPETLRYLHSLVGADPRIKVTFRETNGHICAATNSAADLATGEFVALLDNDDCLTTDALVHIVKALQTKRDADLIYSDEDKIDAAGHRYDPQFKPDWSPELLFSYNYVNHFTVIRRSLFEAVGRFRVGYEGSQDHDLLLRITERTDRVVHIPRILYHWRSLPSSTAAAAGVKRYVHTAGRKAVEEAMNRRGIKATLTVPPFAERLGLPVLSLDGPDDGPSVAVILCGTDELAVASERAIRDKTDYRNLTVIRCPDDLAEGRNLAAARCDDDLLLFVRAGLEPTNPRWLSRFVANLRLPGVGACGASIRDTQGTIVSAGIVNGMRDGVGPADAFAGTPAGAVSYYFYAEVTRNVSAVSGDCLLTTRELFDRLGGFDAERFPRTTWDIDFAARASGLGLRCVQVGEVAFKSPSPLAGEGLGVSGDILRNDDPFELHAHRSAHGCGPDPYHNPNCSVREPFALRGDGPVSPGGPPIRTFVLAHNLAAAEGAPRYLSDIVVGLAKRRTLEPVVASASGGAGEAVYRDAGIPVELYDRPWGKRLIDGLWTRAEYAMAVNDLTVMLTAHMPELVVANTLLTFPVVEAAAKLGLPSVWIIHESYSEAVLSRLFSPFAKGRCEAAFALATRVVPCSHDTAALFARLNSRHNMRVLHNAVAPREIDEYCRRVSKVTAISQTIGLAHLPRIVCVGTICERKGQHTLVEAAARLAREKADFVVHLVGARPGIPYLEYVRQLIERHRLESVVHLVPETDAKPYFRAADAFVCTSHLETFSRSVLEAEAFGLPIVSTPCCGVGEQVAWGHNALPFPIGDAETLARQLRTLLDDPTRQSRMGRASRATFELLPPFDAMLDSFDGVFRTAAGAGPWGQNVRVESATMRKAA